MKEGGKYKRRRGREGGRRKEGGEGKKNIRIYASKMGKKIKP